MRNKLSKLTFCVSITISVLYKSIHCYKSQFQESHSVYCLEANFNRLKFLSVLKTRSDIFFRFHKISWKNLISWYPNRSTLNWYTTDTRSSLDKWMAFWAPFRSAHLLYAMNIFSKFKILILAKIRFAKFILV